MFISYAWPTVLKNRVNIWRKINGSIEIVLVVMQTLARVLCIIGG